MNRRFAFLALPAILIAGLIVGCGGGSGGSEGGGDADTVDHTVVETGTAGWPTFGRDTRRTHYLEADSSLNPPLKQLWSFSDKVLIEFPPAVHDGIAYLADKYGNVRALRLSDREVLWDIQKDKRNVGPPSDTTAPLYSHGHIFVAFMSGMMVSLDADTGKVDWRRDMHSQLESSPIIANGRLYIGTDKAILYALDPDNGKTIWNFHAGAPVKSSPSVFRGQVFFGNYDGVMYSLDARTGKIVWTMDTTKVPPFGDGGFYSSPAIGFRRVFAGRDDGTVFAFDLRSGRVSWSYKTNGDVYGSPAVARVHGTPPTVYIGSYDSNLYALNARTGRKEWKYNVGGPVPGTATVIGHTVYTSDFKTARSVGIDIFSHKKTFSYDSPGYTPMISDGKNLYLVGYFTFHGFTPK